MLKASLHGNQLILLMLPMNQQPIQPPLFSTNLGHKAVPTISLTPKPESQVLKSMSPMDQANVTAYHVPGEYPSPIPIPL